MSKTKLNKMNKEIAKLRTELAEAKASEQNAIVAAMEVGEKDTPDMLTASALVREIEGKIDLLVSDAELLSEKLKAADANKTVVDEKPAIDFVDDRLFPKGTKVFALIEETIPVYNVRATTTRGRIVKGVNSVILLPQTRAVFKTNITERSDIAADIEYLFVVAGFDVKFYYCEADACMKAVIINLNPARHEFNGDMLLGVVK